MKKIFIILSLSLISCQCFAGGKVNRFTLSNGLKVIHKEITSKNLVTTQVFLSAGALFEEENLAGLANLTQSLLFQGTKNRSSEQIAQQTEDIGGNISSDIEHDYSSIGISVLDNNVEKSMDILSDLICNPSFPDKEIEKEKANVLAGIKSRKDHIFYVASDLFNSSFYGTHPYSWTDSGKIETVSEISRADILKWHKEHYNADQMLLVIAGSINLNESKLLAEKYFSKISSQTYNAEPVKAQVPPLKDIMQNSTKFQQAFLMIGFPAPDIKNKDFPVLKVINAILGSRMSGRLFIELREKLSLAYEVSSFYPSRKQLSRFVIYIGLDIKNIDLARNKINEILTGLKNNPVSAQELEETKNYISGTYLIDRQTIARQAWYLGWWEIMGNGCNYDEKYLQDLLLVSAEDVQKAANKYFTEQYVQIKIVPKKR